MAFCAPLILRNASLIFPLRGLPWTSRIGFSMDRLVPAANRTYADALKLLVQLQSNQAIVSSISNATKDVNNAAIPEMLAWARRAGYEPEDFEKHGLRCVHVAGTKGKGSVCMMVENILLQYRKKDGKNRGIQKAGLGKIGLYTSPHLVHVRERIRVDGAPISELMFAKYFFDIWDRLSSSSTSTSQSDKISAKDKPGYFRYLTLMAFHTFISEGVETAIIECGIGGTYDSTNILPASAVTTIAITQLGIDHVGMLGDTTEKIAWHKAGIMKAGVPAFTVAQLPAAQSVLEAQALEKGVDLKIVPRMAALDNGDVKLGLHGDFQKYNASLAVVVASSHLSSLSVVHSVPSAEFIKALETCSHPGRCQIISDGNIVWHLDGAHTSESIFEAATWFKQKYEEAMTLGRPATKTILVFAAQGIGRNPEALLETLLSVKLQQPPPDRYWREIIPSQLFTDACFCSFTVLRKERDDHSHYGTPSLGKEDEPVGLSRTYREIAGHSPNILAGSVQDAVEVARRMAEGEDLAFILVTGSLHLVGGVLQVFDWEKEQTSRAR